MSIQRQTQPAAQGGSMLVDNRCPPTPALANRHSPPTPSPKRRRAAIHAAVAAASATLSELPDNRGATSPTATQNRPAGRTGAASPAPWYAPSPSRQPTAA